MSKVKNCVFSTLILFFISQYLTQYMNQHQKCIQENIPPINMYTSLNNLIFTILRVWKLKVSINYRVNLIPFILSNEYTKFLYICLKFCK